MEMDSQASPFGSESQALSIVRQDRLCRTGMESPQAHSGSETGSRSSLPRFKFTSAHRN